VNTGPDTHERLHELMLDELASGLDPDEIAERDRLAAEFDEAVHERERASAERAVAAAATALLEDERNQADAVPAGLLEALRTSAETFEIDSSPEGTPHNLDQAAIPQPLPRSGHQVAQDRHDRRPDRTAPPGRGAGDDSAAAVSGRIGLPAWAWGGWLAAAASLVVALIITNQQQPVATPAAGDPAARLAAAPDAVAADFAPIDKAGLAPEPHPLARSVEGQIRWADSADVGEMRIAGVEPNDPSEFQYQLWIFDAERPQGDYPGAEGLLSQFPVDGGVFNVTDEGEIVIPVEAKLPVGKAALFAITKEPPGGAVVSDRDIVFVAALGN